MTATRLPPGPKGQFLIGSVGDLRRDTLGFFTRCAREYGDVVSFSLFHVRSCLVNDPALIERILVQETDRVIKAWDVRWLKVALGNGLLTNEGQSWRRQRRLVQPAFHNDRIRAYVEIMVRKTERMLGAWSDGEVRDLHADLMTLTLEIVAEALFGVDLGQRTAVVAHALEEFMQWFETTFTQGFPVPLWVPTPANRKAIRAIRRFDETFAEIMRARQASGTGGTDLLASLLAARDETGAGMTGKQLRDEVITLLLAGHETTAIALSWTLYLLAQHPDVEARLASELQAVLGGRPPSAEDVPRLTFMRQVAQEAMRLYPPAWGFGRETLADLSLGEFVIPRGTQIFLVPWVTHRDPRFFPDPEQFRPERFEPEAERRIPRYAYFPFGGGPRYCVGSNFAMMEAVVLLATIAQRFQFTLQSGHPIALQPAVTLRPRHGIRATVRKRLS